MIGKQILFVEWTGAETISFRAIADAADRADGFEIEASRRVSDVKVA